MGQNNIIELNGKKYDATTGALLGESRIKATPAKRIGLSSRRGRAIDGFIPKSSQGKAAPTVITPSTPHKEMSVQAKKPATSGKHLDIHRTPLTALKRHQPQRPKTLMRHVVSKPDVKMKPAIKTTAPAEMMARPARAIARPLEKKLSVTQVNPFRLARSNHVAKSHHIRRFTHERTPGAQKALANPYTSPARAQAQRPNHYATQAVRQDFRTSAQNTARTSSSTPDIFEAALAHANSHEQAAPRGVKRHSTRRKRLVNVLAGIGAFLLIGGFIGYLNMTNIELRVASMRAGFHAQLPSYQPSGYALTGGIESSEGRVAMNFRSGDRAYTITQEASDWNSSTLLDQNAVERGAPSQTIQSKGRTIYIYDDSNATWVNGGVRYQITGNAPLDTDELVSLATSI